MADGQTIAKAYIQILPSMDNIKSELVKGLGDAPKTTGASAGQTFGSSFGSTLKNVLLGGAAVAAFKTLAEKGVSAMEKAASANAIKSAFDQTFADSASAAADAIGRVADSSGILDTRLTQLGTRIYAFAKSSGGDTAESMDIMERALTAAADSAAYYDTSVEQAAETLQSFLKGNYENDAALGLSATEATRNAAAYELFGQKFSDLTEIQKQETLLKMVEDSQSLSGAVGQASREMDGWENVTGNLSATWEQLLAKIGSPLLENVTPIIQNITAKLQEMTETTDWEVWGDTVTSAFTFFLDNGETIISTVSGIGTALLTWKAASTVTAGVQTLTAAVSGSGGLVAAAGAAVSAINPVTLILSALAGAFVTAYTKSDTFRTNVNSAVKSVYDFAAPKLESLTSKVGTFLSALAGGDIRDDPAALAALQSRFDSNGNLATSFTAYNEAAVNAAQDEFERTRAEDRKGKRIGGTAQKAAETGLPTTNVYTGGGGGGTSSVTQTVTTAEKAAAALNALGDAYVYTGTEEQAHASRLAALQAAYSTAQTNVDKYKTLLDESVASSGASSEMTQYLAQQLESAESAAESAKSALDDYTGASQTAAEKAEAAVEALGDGFSYTADAQDLAAQKLAYYQAQVQSAQEDVDKLTYLFQQSAQETGYNSEQTIYYAQQLNSAESALESAQGALDDYADSANTARQAAEQLKSAISDSASVITDFGGIISDVGDKLDNDFVSDMGSFISGIGKGVTSVLNFATKIGTLIETLQTLSTTLQTVSAVSSTIKTVSTVASVAGTAATTAATTATTAGAAVAGGAAATGILGTIAGVLSGPVGWALLGGSLLIGGGVAYASYKQKQQAAAQQEAEQKAAEEAAQEAAKSASTSTSTVQRITTINFGGVTIIVDGAKYDDPEKQAQQLAYELEMLYKRKEETYA